jgi:Uncharacterised nucleotidyltransferase
MARPHRLLFELAAAASPQSLAPLDADDLVRSAIEHRMHGILWSSVSAGSIRLPPEPTWLLAATDLAVQGHHERLWGVLQHVQHRLEQLGVQTAAAKGVAAEKRWYRRIGERPCRDLDLLLEPGAVDRIADVIEELQPAHPQRSDIAASVRAGTLQSVDLVVDGVAVDLHADLLKVEIPTRGSGVLWSRTHMMQSPTGSYVRVVDAETSLIHFAIHLNKDRFARLLGYADVARLMADDSLDWDFIYKFVSAEGLRIPVFNSLHAVSAALRLRPPAVPRQDGGLRARAWHRLWPASGRLSGYVGLGTGQHRQLWIPWLAQGRTWESIRWWIRRRALPPRELLRVYDPDVEGPYVVRLAVGRVRGWRNRRRAARVAREAGVGRGRRPDTG